MRDREDRELKTLFGHLKDGDQGKVPDFGTVMARAKEEASRDGMDPYPRKTPGRFIPRRFALGGSLLAAAAAAVLLLVQVGGTSDSEFVQVVEAFSSDPAAGAWRSPTDALLDLRGSEILSTVPSLGSSRWLMDPVSAPKRNDL